MKKAPAQAEGVPADQFPSVPVSFDQEHRAESDTSCSKNETPGTETRAEAEEFTGAEEAAVEFPFNIFRNKAASGMWGEAEQISIATYVPDTMRLSAVEKARVSVRSLFAAFCVLIMYSPCRTKHSTFEQLNGGRKEMPQVKKSGTLTLG